MDLDGSDFEGDEDNAIGQRGWVHPDDRLWHHPSELRRRALEGSTRHLRRQRLGHPPLWSLLAVLVLAAGGGGMLVGAKWHFAGAPSNRLPPGLAAQAVAQTTTIPTAPAGPSVMHILGQVTPGIVAISATTPGGERRSYGLVYEPGPLIVTSDSAVEQATTMTVTTSAGMTFPASIVGHDVQTGLAVIKAPGAELSPVPTASSTGIEVGQLAFTVHFAEWPGLAPSLAIGTVLATGLPSPSHDGSMVPDAIMTDTPHDPSDPNGVLVSPAGQVIGLEAGYAGAASHRRWLSIPISLATQIADEMVNTGRVVHGWLGVSSQSAHEPGQPYGITVTSVSPGSPAARAGLVAGDVIMSADENRVSSFANLAALVRCLPPGSPVALRILHHDSLLAVTATLAADSG